MREWDKTRQNKSEPRAGIYHFLDGERLRGLNGFQTDIQLVLFILDQ